MKKNIFIVFLLLVIIILTFVVYKSRDNSESLQDPISEPAEIKITLEHSWIINKISDEETEIKIQINGAEKYVGKFNGSCANIDTISSSGWSLLENEISAVICWFAGGGEEFGLFKENDKLFIKRGQLDEGSAEVEPFRGNFETIMKI